MIFILFANDYSVTNNVFCGSQKQIMVFNNVGNFKDGKHAISHFKSHLATFWNVEETKIIEDERDFIDIFDDLENKIDIAYTSDNISEFAFLRCGKLYAIVAVKI